MKAPQDCTGVNLKLEAKKSKKKKKKDKDGENEEDGESIQGNGSLTRRSTSSSVTPSITTPTSIPTTPQRTVTTSSMRPPNLAKHIASAPPATKYLNSPAMNSPTTNGGSQPGSSQQKAKALFKYDATSPEELSIKPSDTLTILEPDDGSGWILAKTGNKQGIVPASYVEIQSEVKKGPPVAPRRGKKAEEVKKRVFQALYDYDAGSELELSIKEGDVVALVGEDKGDGWTEVELKGKIGSVPSNYIEPLDKMQ
jgi:formin-binding protein 1